jgi:hypothetical protein
MRHSPALAGGTLFHQTLADWLLHPKLDPTQICDVHFAKMYDAAREQYRVTNGFYPMGRELGEVAETGALIKAMMGNYRDYYTTPLPEGFTCIMPEQAVVVDIPNAISACHECNGKGTKKYYDGSYVVAVEDCQSCAGTGEIQHQLEGTFDAIIADRNGKVFVLDHKTYGARPKVPTIENAFQFRCYVWAARQLGIDNVVGFLYDGAFKRPSPPRGKTMDDLFFRMPVTYNEAQMDEIGAFLAQKACMMYDTTPTSALLNFNRRWEGCWDCSVEELCTAISRSEDIDWLINERYTHRERTTAFADDIEISTEQD